jgi:hypothetical protein
MKSKRPPSGTMRAGPNDGEGWVGGQLSSARKNTLAITPLPRNYQDLPEETMANVFIEPRPKGHREHSPIKDYVVEDQPDHVLHTSETQAEAIAWVRAQGYTPLVARVRDLSDKKKPDRRRAP